MKPEPNKPSPILNPMALVFENVSWSTDCKAIANRTDTVFLVRLLSEHAPLFKAHAHLLDPVADPTCSQSMAEPQAMEHWMQKCPNLDVLRQRAIRYRMQGCVVH